MIHKRKLGRPLKSCNVCILPEYREKPDVEKLGRALIAVTMRLAEIKKAEEQKKKEDTVM